MSRLQVSAETSASLLQAKDLLDEARRLRPGPKRNQMRERAKTMRERTKLEARSGSALDLDRPETA